MSMTQILRHDTVDIINYTKTLNRIHVTYIYISGRWQAPAATEKDRPGASPEGRCRRPEGPTAAETYFNKC